MIASEFISLVKTGSLNQTSVTESDILAYTNLGIQVLSDDFDMLSKNTVITLTEGVTEYNLPEDFEAVYIITTPGKYWRNDLGLIKEIVDPYFEVGVNIKGDYNSIFIDNNLKMTVPLPITGQILTMDYKASITKVTDTSKVLPIATQYITALMLYVTYMGYLQAVGTSHADTQTAFSMYSKAVDRLNETATFVNQYGYNDKFTKRGFV